MGYITTIATAIIAVFTICLWWSTTKLWKTTTDAANATKRSVDNISKIERAYIFVTVEQHPKTCDPVFIIYVRQLCWATVASNITSLMSTLNCGTLEELQL